MSTTLEIFDGVPYWWDSADIWVVPGNDPNGSSGQPIAGKSAFLWGRVHNTGKQPVKDAKVNFYWSNPALGVLRSNSTFVGSAFVDLEIGETKEVLCVIPWFPTVVNNGHECLVAEVLHIMDPLSSPLMDDFDPPNNHQIAQKNLSVITLKNKALIIPIQITATKRKERNLQVTTDFEGELDPQTLNQMGLKDFKPAKDRVKSVLSIENGCEETPKEAPKNNITINLKANTTQGIYLKIWPIKLNPKTYTMIHVISKSDQKVVGGSTFIIVNERGTL